MESATEAEVGAIVDAKPESGKGEVVVEIYVPTVQRHYEMVFPSGDRSIAWDLRRGRPYEWRLLRLAAELRPTQFMDIGAHIGNHTVYMAMHGVHVTAVEPNPEARKYLARNIHANGLDGLVDVIPRAVGAEAGHARLVGDGGDLGKVSATFGDGDVEVVTVDSLNVAADLLKVDVEGAELEVLSGASALLASAKPAVVVESHSHRRAVARLLAPFGYRQVARSLAYSPTWLFLARQEHLSLSVRAWRWSLGGAPRRVGATSLRWLLRKRHG